MTDDARVVAITGAGTGIGRATSLRFAREGFTVVANGRRSDKLEEVKRAASNLPGRIIPVAGDVGVPETAEELTRRATEAGDFGWLVNNAGVGWAYGVYRQMRRRTFGPLFRALPNLELLSRMMRRAALAGFLFLTVGLNLGILIGHSTRPDGFDYTDPHVLLTLALWVHFGLIAFSGSIRGLTARRASWAATAGLVSLLLLIVLTLLPSLTSHAL
jgi:NAD(P)-dependent dehydrogenase (short-subunit alcohol dehydrogenase family)